MISTVNAYYADHKRLFPWRDIENPYYVMVSEVMLQQTQTSRVIEKFHQFITAFPTVYDLAGASLVAVLVAWQGLGYNRRGKFLHMAAQQIVALYDGVVPRDPALLVKLPGIGAATAASIAAFAYNEPTVFIETNIRAVFIHFFFKDASGVHDRDIMPLIAQALDHTSPRQWYYALMDYGVMLKKEHKNPSRQSAHHVRQSKFEGSDRQIRGAVVRYLTTTSAQLHCDDAVSVISAQLGRLIVGKKMDHIIERLIEEKIVFLKDNKWLVISER